MLLSAVSRGYVVPLVDVPGGYVEKPLVSVGERPGIRLHGVVGSVPAMKNSVASTPGQPGAHSVLVSRSTVFVMIPAGLGQSGGAGLRRYTSVMNAVQAGAARR